MGKLFILFLSLTLLATVLANFPVDYTKDGNNWDGICKSGKKQSPINLIPTKSVISTFDKIEYHNYDYNGNVDIIHIGDTYRIEGFETWGSNQPSITGGNLTSRYHLIQIHFHWSDDDHKGSEHTVYGVYLPMEIHYVHIKENLTLDEALNIPDGIMVVGVFAKITADDGHFSSLMEGFMKLDENRINETVVHSMTPNELLPLDRLTYYRYQGSLTTPTCNEAVIWTVLSTPISISPSQMKCLRKIRTGLDLASRHNVRPAQPLNDRTVYLQLNSAHIFNIITKPRYRLPILSKILHLLV